jgi:hypothetical protein
VLAQNHEIMIVTKKRSKESRSSALLSAISKLSLIYSHIIRTPASHFTTTGATLNFEEEVVANKLSQHDESGAWCFKNASK